MADIAVGEPLSIAAVKLQAFGEVREITLGTGGGLSAGDYIVVGCKNRVWGISRKLQPTFQAFARTAQKLELQQGVRATAETFSDDGSQGLAVVTLQWNLGDGSTRYVMYADAVGGPSVSEGVKQTSFCSSQ